MVPIREAEPIGAIGAYWAATQTPAAETVELLQALANTTAVALENVRVYQELEERVHQRTTQLEEANRELDAFSYSVSHDLRAPLRHVSGFANLLKEQPLGGMDDQSRHYVDRITSSVDHMAQLIDALLAFARLGRRPLDTRPLDLWQLVREAVAEASREAGSRAIDWTVGDTHATVLGDPTLIRQALVNLLSNAVKYTRGRTPARIEIGTGPDERNQLAIFVRDNGAGFDPQYADRLFGVFQRLHASSEFEGTGIGLANVRRIIGRHGGRTWAEGVVNEGATFWFTLPRP